MGIKDITICASSLGKANDAIVPYIEDGTITGIQSSGVRGQNRRGHFHRASCRPCNHALPRRPRPGHRSRRSPYRHRVHRRSHLRRVRKLPGRRRKERLRRPVLRHGGRQRTPTRWWSSPTAWCPSPTCPASISMIDVDYVVRGGRDRQPGEDRHRRSQADHGRAEADDGRTTARNSSSTRRILRTVFPTRPASGGASIASTISLGKIMEERGIKMGFGVGGITDAHVRASGAGADPEDCRYPGL